MHKSVLILVLALIGFDVLFSNLATSESRRKGSYEYHSTSIADGTDFSTRIHLFNPWNYPVSVQLQAVGLEGGAVPIFPVAGITRGFSQTSIFSATLAAHGSLQLDTIGMGNGPFAGSLQLDAAQSVAGWVTERNFQGLDLNAQTTSVLRTRNQGNQPIRLVGAKPRITGFGDGGALNALAWLNVRDPDTSTFSGTGTFSERRVLISFLEPGSFNIVTQVETGFAFNGTLVEPLVDLAPQLDPSVGYTVQVDALDGYPLLSSLTYWGQNVLAKQVGLTGTGTFSSTNLGQSVNRQSARFLYLPSQGVNGEIRYRNTFSFSPLAVDLRLQGDASQQFSLFSTILDYSGEFATSMASLPLSSADQSGNALMDFSFYRIDSQITTFATDAMTLNEPSPLMYERLVLPLDGALDWNGALAQSVVSLYNHENQAYLIMFATLDAQGQQIEVTQRYVQPGLSSIPASDLVNGNLNTATLLMEPGDIATFLSADLLIYGNDGAHEVLDHITAQSLTGDRTVGTYPFMLINWNDENIATCLGNGVDILDIVTFIEQGFSCD